MHAFNCISQLCFLVYFNKVNPRIILFGYTLSSCRDLDWNCVGSVISLGTADGGIVIKLCPTLATPWTAACQAPLFVGLSRQEWVPFPSPGDLPNSGIEPSPVLLHCRQILYRLSYKGSPKEQLALEFPLFPSRSVVCLSIYSSPYTPGSDRLNQHQYE